SDRAQAVCPSGSAFTPSIRFGLLNQFIQFQPAHFQFVLLVGQIFECFSGAQVKCRGVAGRDVVGQR
ncbi:MAG: hypothetical protein ACKON9_13800, partial [Planctomycetaceae bacterium]